MTAATGSASDTKNADRHTIFLPMQKVLNNSGGSRKTLRPNGRSDI
jgi:hypothetical protein